MKKFNEYKGLDLSKVAEEVLNQWKEDNTFEKSLELRDGAKEYVFYEGPPSANGTPGIHHVMARAIKDVICRYKSSKGYKVERKAGWDTHGLPVELGVEKKMGITKEDIGKTISVVDYNKACREDVMMYTDLWEDMTAKMGYWVDMQNPYITYDNKFIETLWYLLGELYKKGLLYKGYTIQPYSPAAGTGLSNHELNQPGCYKDVKDTTCIAQFKVVGQDQYFLAWTTTPWTLPSNTALAVGENIDYSYVKTVNPYTKDEIVVIMANCLVDKVMAKQEFEILKTVKGSDLKGMRYEQLIPWIKPDGDAFRVITGDFVTTEDGTGIVHIAPTFGADDNRVAKVNDIAGMLLVDGSGKEVPMVDRTGKFYNVSDLDADYAKMFVTPEYKEWQGKFVKNAYDDTKGEKDETLDIEICMWLKHKGLVFKIEKHTHNYPHCWRTDKPVLYYPLDSWFIKTTEVKDRLIALNETINWKPASTGSGRFGKWLENLVDWNLSRSRYWGTPLPIWASEDMSEMICISSVGQLKNEINKAVKAGVMKTNPLESFVEGDFSKENYDKFDLHRPFVDEIVLVGASGAVLRRESDLIDVWFDSGAMPYAQVHYPFECSGDEFATKFPADFIAEGVDQTRGWFFTLHALAVMLFDSVAFKNIISNGLVLDKNGNKMSKRLGNAVDPFDAMAAYGADAVRWYMISNSQPWDNLKFDVEGIDEVRRKFFGTLYNTYGFFALYSNIDGYQPQDELCAKNLTNGIDKWIISRLNSLIKTVGDCLEDYDITNASRAIQEFVCEDLSNWYVRLNRKRFWGGGMSEDKKVAYDVLYSCLLNVSKMMSFVAPFYSERLFRDLTGKQSVHFEDFPTFDHQAIDADLEQQMELASRASSLVLALRRKVSIKVRQPLQKMIIPVLDVQIKANLQAVEGLILSEVNVKSIEYIEDTTGVITKKIKPNFKALGGTYGKYMKGISAACATMDQADIARLEKSGDIELEVMGDVLNLTVDHFEITSEDMPGWLVASEGKLTIALDVNVTPELRAEGIAREIVNRVQNIRKDSGFEVTDKVTITIEKNSEFDAAVELWKEYICSQTLAVELIVSNEKQSNEIEIDGVNVTISVAKN